MSDDVPLLAEIAGQPLGVRLAAAENCQKTAGRFQHVFVDGIAAAGSQRGVDGAQGRVTRLVLARPTVGADLEPQRHDEGKDRVETRWRDDEITKRLDAKTAEIVDKLKAGMSLADVAAAADGLMVDTKWGLKRQGTAILPAAVVAQVFRTSKDGIGTADGKTRAERIIFKVTDIKEPSYEAGGAAAKPLQDQLRTSYGDELLSQYVVRLESDLDTNINQQALNQAVGRATNNQTNN